MTTLAESNPSARPSPSAKAKVCVILNPAAKGEKARALCAKAEQLLPNSVWRHTGQTGHARDLASQAVREGFQTIVAGGGDGTLNEVLNGIGDVPGAFDHVQFGVLPLGTVNVFARELGLPLRPDIAAEVLRAGKTRTIDLGRADFTASGKPQRRYFISIAGAGLDSRAVELISWQMKKKIGALSYIVAGFRALMEEQPRIVLHGDASVEGELVLIGNGRFYGGSFAVFPKAGIEDGLLHFLVVPKVTVPRAMAGGAGLLIGRLAQFCGAVEISAPSVKLTSSSRVPLQLDGENAGELPATLSVLPKALRVIVP